MQAPHGRLGGMGGSHRPASEGTGSSTRDRPRLFSRPGRPARRRGSLALRREGGAAAGERRLVAPTSACALVSRPLGLWHDEQAQRFYQYHRLMNLRHRLYRLLAFMVRNRGQFLNHAQLLESMGEDYQGRRREDPARCDLPGQERVRLAEGLADPARARLRLPVRPGRRTIPRLTYYAIRTGPPAPCGPGLPRPGGGQQSDADPGAKGKPPENWEIWARTRRGLGENRRLD